METDFLYFEQCIFTGINKNECFYRGLINIDLRFFHETNLSFANIQCNKILILNQINSIIFTKLLELQLQRLPKLS